ncbi:endonuclease domain-containing 1 protein [Tiliqua scincoides]|uniref:endonuclease domain-containing 1 protein n=1 Tax=Tiliqua scincoides TaxID=71010 RepID=UPI003462CC85
MWVRVLCLCLLAAALPGPAWARVVPPEEPGFAECDAFFYEQAPPEGALGPRRPHSLKICQHYKQEPRFATLYSALHRAPLYSAFRYSEAAPGGEECWLVEPQVDDLKNGLEGMMPEEEIVGSVNNLGTNQALAEDYVVSGYEKGQLNPGFLHKDDNQIATYTLTNAVPVTAPVEETWHWEIENLVSRALAPHCGNGKDLYLLSGAVPSDEKIRDKVSVPKSFWLAACCDDGSDSWSVAFAKEADAENRLEELTVEELEKTLLNGTQLFKKNCNKGKNNPTKQKAMQQSAKGIRSEKPAPRGKKCLKQKMCGKPKKEGFLKKLYNCIIAPIFTLIKLVCNLICQLTKLLFRSLCSIIKGIVKGICTFLTGIGKVLLKIFVDSIQVGVNILNDVAKHIYNILMLMYRIVCIPVHIFLNVVSFPFYVLGAIPGVLKEIVSGLGGLAMLIINAITKSVNYFNNIVSKIAHKLLPKISLEL